MNQPHDSAHTHVTGESLFIDDMPSTQGEVLVGVVYSTEAHATILSIDFKKALEIPGVRAVFTARDLQHNLWGSILQDQPLLAQSVVQYVGEAVAVVAAVTREALQKGIKAVKVRYEKLEPVFSIAEAKARKQFIGGEKRIERGSVDKAMAKSPHRLEGRIVIHGADHFYLESQVSLVYPKEKGQLEVYCSTQHPTEVQHLVAHALGLSSKDVTCIVPRMGGGFGGKESQAAPFAAYAALVARRLNVPARLVLTKDEDMVMTGKRNPFENTYQVGFDADGTILALDVQLFSDGGAFADLSTSILERALLHCDNAYYIENVRLVGNVCRTNIHPHTAFRGFGGPKGVATIERIIEEVAHQLGKDPLDVRMKNVYREEGGRNVTHYGQVVENNCLPRLFQTLEKSAQYRERRNAIDAHNRAALRASHPQSLKGLSLTAVKFGISFTTRFLNQGNALVNIYRDGSVQISTGATEMGQGVNTRIAQSVANELGIPFSQVRVLATSTDRNANTSPTAASSGTDLNAAAAVLAARKIKRRLSLLAIQVLALPVERRARQTAPLGTAPDIVIPLADPGTQDPNDGADWETGIATYDGVDFHQNEVTHDGKKMAFTELVNEAYLNRISICDYAHYRIGGLSFDKVAGKGQAFLYFTQGVAASEVSVDLDTGEVKTLRTDLLMDLGRPINEELDRGQVWGGFVQGLGWVTTENLFYREGTLLSHSPSTYKIPSVQDIPREFNLELLSNNQNYANFKGTKAVGEPPLLLCLSVWTAIQNALTYLPAYVTRYPVLPIPATAEAVLRTAWPEKFLAKEGN